MRLAKSLAAVSIVAAAGHVAHAQVDAHYNNMFDYSYEVTGMPDFDQKRVPIFSIPGCSNGGSLYCGPTSVMNIMGFISTHGWSHISPGDSPWEDFTTADGFWSNTDRERYAHITNEIESLAIDFMGMDPESGTGAEKLRNGAIAWLDHYEETWLDHFDIDTWGLNGDEWTDSGEDIPQPAEIAYLANDGALIIMRYGRYFWQRDGDLVELLERDGGHIVAVQAMDDGESHPRVVYRNSSTGSTESPFAQDKFRRSDRRAVKTWITNGGDAGAFRHAVMRAGMTSDDFDPEETKLPLIDDYMLVKPKYGFSLVPDGNMLDITLPGFGDGDGYTYDFITPPDGGPAVDARLSPTGLWRAVLVGGSTPGLHVMHRPSGAVTRIADTADPRALVFAPDRHLYTADYDAAVGATTLRVYEHRGVEHVDSWRENNAASLPGIDIAAMTYDGRAHDLLVIPEATYEVRRFPRLLAGTSTSEPLPSSLPLVGSVYADLSPADGTLWLSVPNADLLAQLALVNGEWVEVRSHYGHGIEGISIDTKGDVFASVGGVVRQFRPDATGGLYEPGTSPFNGQPCGDTFQISRSSSNVNNALYDLPGSHDLDADDVETDPVCRADYNDDGTVNTQDFLAYLNAWAAGNLAADWDLNGVINTVDLLGFLNDWTSGCDR